MSNYILMNNIKLIIFAFALSILLQACSSPDGENTGSEYMPDMAHSLAIEANTYNYYYYNTWDNASTITLAELVKNPDLPVAGTIPRGYAGGFLDANGDMDVVLGNDEITNIRITPNGSVPYYYEDTDASRELATAELLANPFPITADGLVRGKNLYEIFCGVCHGKKADGLGYLYDSDQNPNAKYLAAPANLVSEEFQAASNGRFYHAIMYGKNVMGGYADKISYEERWQVIHYIRSLQAKEAGGTYNADENTYNAAHGIPMAAMPKETTQTAMMEDHHDTADHGDDHGHPGGEQSTDGHH